MLSLPQIQNVCLVHGGHEQCRYLEADPQKWGKYYCKKHTPDAKHLDDLVEEYLRDCKKDGKDPKQGTVGIGNHCNGYPFFKDLLQGFDQDV